jgi:hypothetical protein
MPDTPDIQQVSAMLFADKETELALARCGALPGTKIGGAWVFLHSHVLDFFAQQDQVDTQLRRLQVDKEHGKLLLVVDQQPPLARCR